MSHETQMLLGLFLGIAIMIFLVMKTKTHTFIALLLAALITGLIGKICFHGCIIRHFQFRKCLPMYSNYASNMGGCIRKAAVARL